MSSCIVVSTTTFAGRRFIKLGSPLLPSRYAMNPSDRRVYEVELKLDHLIVGSFVEGVTASLDQVCSMTGVPFLGL